MTKHVSIVLVFSLVLCFSHIHQGTLGADAIRYAKISEQINESGEWIKLFDPMAGTEYYNKPPMLFWLTAGIIRNFGFSTFCAKAPAALFTFAFLLLLWITASRYGGFIAGASAVLLTAVSRNFTRSILDLNFEAIAACGAMLCLLAFWQLLNENHKKYTPHALLSLGLFLFLQSKPPYVLLMAVPFGLTSIFFAKARSLLLSPPVLLAVILPFVLVGSWYLALNPSYLLNSTDNQFVEPFRLRKSYLENQAHWLVLFVFSFFPLSLLGVLSLQKIWRKKEEASGFDFLLSVTALQSIPIILICAHRDRYLLIPMLAFTLLASKDIGKWAPAKLLKLIERGLIAAAVLMILLFGIFDLKVHRDQELIAAAKQRPDLFTEDLWACLDFSGDGKKGLRAEMTSSLFELEFGRGPKMFWSGSLPVTECVNRILLVNDNCFEALREKGIRSQIIAESRKASWIKIINA